MKKKAVALCATVALAAVAAGGATLAYFTDTDSETNTFTMGNVEIALHEGAYANVQKNGAPVDEDGNVDNSKANPNAQLNEDGSKDDTFGYDYLDSTYQKWLADQVLMPGTQGFNRIQKRIFVENTGSQDAYVRVIVGVPSELDAPADASANILHFNQVTGAVNNNLGDWVDGGQYAFTQDGYNYYVYYYTQVVEDGDATNAEALSYFYLDEKVDFDGTSYFYMDGEEKVTLDSIVDGKIVVPVYAEAIQAAGFDTYAAAWAAYGDPAIKADDATDITASE